MRPRQNVKITASILTRMNVPEKYWEARFASVRNPNAQAALLAFLRRIESGDTISNGVFLSGDKGSGKTSIASIILKHARRNGRTCLFATSNNIIRWQSEKSTYDDGMSYVDRCRNVEFMAIDDLGSELSYNPENRIFVKGYISTLVKERDSRRLSTVITTRLDLESIGRDFGENLRDLVLDSMVTMFFNGESVSVSEIVLGNRMASSVGSDFYYEDDALPGRSSNPF